MTEPSQRLWRTSRMCQVVRPDCEVTSNAELHLYFGPGKVLGAIPCTMLAPLAAWWSEGTAFGDEAWSDEKSLSVFAANDAVLRRGVQAKKRTHHLLPSVGTSVTFPFAQPAFFDQDSPNARTGFDSDTHSGRSTALFGPRHVQAAIGGSNSIAVLRYTAGSSQGGWNFTVCSENLDLPRTHAVQTPNTVLLGMTSGDTATAWITYGAQAVLDYLIGWAVSKIGGALVGGLVAELSHQIERRVGRAIAHALEWPIRKAMKKGVSRLLRGSLRELLGGREPRLQTPEIESVADFWDREILP